MKTKNKKESIAWICLHVFGSPFIWIIGYVLFKWYGVVGCLVLFFVSYKLWKRFGKHYDAKLSTSPSFIFGNKKWRLFNK